MEETWKTTARDFFYFKARAKEWIRRFGMINYRVMFFHKDGEDGCQNSYAWFKSERNTANIGLGITWDRPVTKRHLDQSALHEVLHLVLDNITYAANQRFTPMGFIEAEEEEIIARLEKVILNGKEVC